MRCQEVFPIAEISQVGESRRVAVRLSSDAGWSETDQGRLAIITTELGTNILKHAQHGTILIRVEPLETGSEIEILAVDAGCGMHDLELSLTDGYSTAGTSGTGLGAVRRLSDVFRIYSQPGRGTVVLSKVYPERRYPGIETTIEWSVISAPAPHEIVCGDSWGFSIHENGVSACIADGLGHGPDAAEAAVAALQVFQNECSVNPSDLLRKSHQALAGTRGAAVAVASLDQRSHNWVFSGIGNISATLCSSDSKRGMVSHNGIVGGQVRKFQDFNYPSTPSELLIMHSDGLQTRWSLDDYPGLEACHPAVIVGVLYRDFDRKRDDITVLAVRIR